MSELGAESPFLRRFWAYLLERFPPAPYTVLVLLFFGSAVLVGWSLGGRAEAWWPGAAIVLLAFFHLRVFDEHKDHEQDRVAHPERVLSRGIVTLRELRMVGGVAIGLEALLAMGGGPRVLIAWGATFLFSVGMAREFFVGDWLREHLVLYAVTHNPVVAGLAMVGWACSGADWNPLFLAYVAMVSFGSLAFEVGRKFRLPSEEIPGVDSYTSVLGRDRALLLLRGTMLATAACLLFTLRRLDGTVVEGWNAFAPQPLTLWMWGSLLFSLLPLLAGGALVGDRAPAKRVEGGSTLLLLLAMLVAGVFAWP